MACEFCGQPGGWDLAPGSSFRKQGRRNQGAMTPQWCEADWSETLQAVVCPPCFKQRFYRRASRSPSWPVDAAG